MFTYDQSSGAFSLNGKELWCGYSGFGPGKNNPAAEMQKAIGPVPAGLWHIAGDYDSKKTGPRTIVLVPDDKTNTFGRSDFRIHGDSIANPGSASHGCIILPRFIRQLILDNPCKLLTVVH